MKLNPYKLNKHSKKPNKTQYTNITKPKHGLCTVICALCFVWYFVRLGFGHFKYYTLFGFLLLYQEIIKPLPRFFFSKNFIIAVIASLAKARRGNPIAYEIATVA